MSKINVLDSSVFNRIAAGEVVDRPASVVKELIENSIDSGATNIDITVKNGGRYIKVSDNGCGIDGEDIKTAFLPHATSKIKDLCDLDAINTLGFRGEALPSIASVAKVTMISRIKDAETGNKIVIENGKILDFTSAGAPFGTTVIVSDLFENVPARLKFLRSNRSEEGEISTLVQKFILANYNVAISLTISDKEIYRSEGRGLEEAAYSAIGPEILTEYDYIHEEIPGLEIYGYVSKPAYTKHNRSYQTLIVNGRYVINQDISFWIYNCFSHVLMTRQYPAYVIFINVPADMVDINVHPSKMEVKFIDLDRIKRMLSKAISNDLAKATHEPKQIELEKSGAINTENKTDVLILSSDESEDRGSLELRGEIPFDNTFNINRTESKPSYGQSGISIRHTQSENDFSRSYEKERTKDYDPKIFGETSQAKHQAVQQTAENHVLKPQSNQASQYSIFKEIIADGSGISISDQADISDYRYCGKIFNTYLIIENHEEIIIIDQHAAHEKLLYDELAESVESGKNTIQDLLIPYVFDVDHNEAELIDSHLDEIKSVGFELNKLSGNTYSLSAVPMILCDIDMSGFVYELIDLLKRDRFGKLPFIKNSLMQSACKAAIKGEMDITDDDAKLLIRDIKEKHIDLFCPHGRPIAVKLKKTEIEKWFKRIV